MRFAAAIFMLVAAEASAWTFTPVPTCTLTHSTDTATLTITYDPTLAVPYALIATRSAPWPEAPVFSMTFFGPNGFAISTNRHALSDDALTLRVEDTGFGNVLNGLEFNTTAQAILGDAASVFPLENLAPAMQAFRACPAPATS